MRRALVGLDGMKPWQLVELQGELARAMTRCPFEGPPAQEREHRVIQAFSDYVGAVFLEHSSSITAVPDEQHSSGKSGT